MFREAWNAALPTSAIIFSRICGPVSTWPFRSLRLLDPGTSVAGLGPTAQDAARGRTAREFA
eukprot:8969540-Alexandrium_andersonii.AAC.1